MPILGTLDIKQWVSGGVAVFDNQGDDSWELKKAEIVTVSFEIQPMARALLPPGMHPSVPMYLSCNVAKFPDSPVGPFTLAYVMVSGRVGIRPRGFVLKALVDSEAARRELATRWGFPVSPGQSRIVSRHDRVQAEVRDGGAVVLECELTDREPLEGLDIEPLPATNLARNRADDKLVLVQVEPHFEYGKVERGRARLLSFDQAAWRTGGKVQFNQSIVGLYSVSDVALPAPRFVMDPERPSSQMPKAAA